MEYNDLVNLIDGLAQEFLFQDSKEIDIPAAGKLLNHLEKIVEEAKKTEVSTITKSAESLSKVLEGIIFNTIKDKADAAEFFESGIHLMQEIADSYVNTGKYKGDINKFLEKYVALTGVAIAETALPEKIDAVSVPSPAEVPEKKVAPPAEVPEKKAAPVEDEPIVIQDESLTRDFISEGLEYIGEIEVNILNLENEPENKDYINAIFRPFHSIKGVASFLNLEKIRSLAHNLETLLDKARNGEIAVTPTLIDVVLDGADALKALIGQLRDVLEGKKGETVDLDIPSLQARINRIVQGFEVDHGAKKIGEILVADGALSKGKLDQTLKDMESSPDKKLGQTLIEEGIVKPKQVAQALRKQVDQVTDLTTVRVDTTKLDDLIDMVGELVITQTMIQRNLKVQLNANKDLTSNIAQFFHITSSLQRVSTSMRMIPIKQTFQRMSRLVRDLAKNAGKIISVELVGEDTEMDRNMVEEIYNPLVHMIRNSVDHGLEPTEERVKAGKPEKGIVTLKAYHRGGNVVIEIADDGRGLNKEKILSKAVKSGTVQNPETMTDSEIYKLIFLPGLSTAEKITDVSGRGVGMDVVKRAIEKLRGKIEIESTFGKGTSIITRFPLTLAIIDGMIVKVGKESYILPTLSIRQALRPSRDKYTNVVGKGEMIDAMGKLMPLIKLYKVFNIEPEQKDPWDALVVVVDSEKGPRCLMVDKIIGKAEVVVKSLGEGLKNIRGVAGGAILGNGRIGLIIDTEGLFELDEQ